MQRQKRVEGKLPNFQMGNLQHGKLRAMWEDKLEDCDEAGTPRMDDATLFRRYLSKLPLDFQNEL